MLMLANFEALFKITSCMQNVCKRVGVACGGGAKCDIVSWWCPCLYVHTVSQNAHTEWWAVISSIYSYRGDTIVSKVRFSDLRTMKKTPYGVS